LQHRRPRVRLARPGSCGNAVAPDAGARGRARARAARPRGSWRRLLAQAAVLDRRVLGRRHHSLPAAATGRHHLQHADRLGSVSSRCVPCCPSTVWHQLRREGFTAGRCRVERLMRTVGACKAHRAAAGRPRDGVVDPRPPGPGRQRRRGPQRRGQPVHLDPVLQPARRRRGLGLDRDGRGQCTTPWPSP
jgi:hypothetical protein